RFVLVRWPQSEEPGEYAGDGRGQHRGRRAERIDLHRGGFQADNAASVFHSPCLLMSTSARTGTSSKSSSASPSLRRRNAPSAGHRPSRRSSIPFPCTSEAPVSTPPTTGAAVGRRS